MASKEKKVLVSAAALVFLLYILFAVQPIPPETVLVNVWLEDLETGLGEIVEARAGEPLVRAGEPLVPFTLGNRFGYAGASGGLVLNKTTDRYVSISSEYWSEYDSAPDSLVIQNPADGNEITVNPAAGYPLFLDGKIFLVGKDQSSLTRINGAGLPVWRYDFEAPLTSVDAAGGYLLAGTVDGVIELLDEKGGTLFPSYAPASRITVILGCRISSDGSKLALVAGIDEQRFIFLERYGSSDYRVTYHEPLTGEAFRREVHMAFINNDSTVVFERPGGLGIFDVKTRTRRTLSLDGKVESFDGSGEDGLFFFIISEQEESRKRLIALSLPGKVLLSAPFVSENVFLSRRGNRLFVGGGMTLGSFALDRM